MTDPSAPVWSTPRVRVLLLPVVAGVLLAADVATKRLAEARLDGGRPRWLVDGWFGLDLRFNSGVAFSVLDGRRSVWLLLIGATLGLLWLARDVAGSAPTTAVLLPIVLVAAGAAGNLVDRLGDGRVTDFVAVGPWPRFNVADSSLSLGLVLLLVRAVTTKGHDPDDR